MWDCPVFPGPQEEFFYPELILYPNRNLCITYHDTLSLLTEDQQGKYKTGSEFLYTYRQGS